MVHLSGRDVDDSLLAIYGKAEAKKNNEPIIKRGAVHDVRKPMSQLRSIVRKCGLPVDAMSGDKIEGLLIEFLKIIGDAFPSG